MPCTCNDESQTKRVICLNCQKGETQKLEHFERVSGCSEHHDTIAICSGSSHLCQDCENANYYLESSGFGPFSVPVVKKKDDPNYVKKFDFMDMVGSNSE